MGLITINDINQVVSETPRDALVQECDNVFQGLGCLPGEYHIEIDTKIPPVQHSVRMVCTSNTKREVETKLMRIGEQGNHSKGQKSTPWISSLVAVLKQAREDTS